jgi:hypothetical protein
VMRVEVYRSLWGVWDGSATGLSNTLDETAQGGTYDGVEANPLALDAVVDDVPVRLASTGLGFLPRIQTFGRTVDEHLNWLRRSVIAAQRYGSSHVVVQGGRDSWDDAEASRFFAGALDLERELQCVLAHETHRGRILFEPWRTVRVLDRHPDLWLAADYSHWVVVAERLLDHEHAILERCAPRVLHIDARVGHPEGPQVSDPRLARHHDALEAHELWWAGIAAAQRAAGAERLTVVPEFGPAPYQPPGAPPSDEINTWMADRARALLEAPR